MELNASVLSEVMPLEETPFGHLNLTKYVSDTVFVSDSQYDC